MCCREGVPVVDCVVGWARLSGSCGRRSDWMEGRYEVVVQDVELDKDEGMGDEDVCFDLVQEDGC